MLKTLTQKYHHLRQLWLDVMWLELCHTLTLPLLTLLCFRQDSPLFPSTTNTYHRGLYFGLTIGLGKCASVIGHIVLGRVSDRYGRRFILTLSAIGLSVSALCGVFSIMFEWPLLLILSVIIAEGFYSVRTSAMVLAQEAVSSSESVQALSYTQLFIAAGATIGPILGGLCVPTIASLWHYILPWWLVIIGAAILAWRSRTALQVTPSHKTILSIRASWQELQSIVRLQTNLRWYWLLLLLPQISWGAFYELLAPILQTHFHDNGLAIGWAMGVMAACVMIASAWIVPSCRQRFTESTLISIGGVMMVLGLLAFSLSISLSASWLTQGCVFFSIPFIATGDVMVFCVLYAKLNACVSHNHRGLVAGTAYASCLFIWAIDAFIGGHFMVRHLTGLAWCLPLGAIAFLFARFWAHFHIKIQPVT